MFRNSVFLWLSSERCVQGECGVALSGRDGKKLDMTRVLCDLQLINRNKPPDIGDLGE